jgi:hypothetical protein
VLETFASYVQLKETATQEMGFEGTDSIHLAEDTVQRRALLRMGEV